MCSLGLVIVGTFAHVQKNVMSDPECVPEEIGRPKTKTATSMGLVVGVVGGRNLEISLGYVCGLHLVARHFFLCFAGFVFFVLLVFG